MDQIFRGKIKGYGVFTLVAFIVAGVLLLTKFKGWEIIPALLKGPVNLSSADSLDACEGKYVYCNVKYPLEVYLERYEEINGTKHITDYGYIIWEDTIRDFFGIIVPASEKSEIEDQFDQVWSYLTGESSKEPTGQYYIAGTLKRMDDEQLEYYRETMDYLFADDASSKEDTYYIEKNKIYDLNIYGIITLMIGCAGILFWGIFVFIKSLGNSYRKQIDQCISSDHHVSEQIIEADFKNAIPCGENIWTGRRWIFAVRWQHVQLIDNRKVIWAYYFQKKGTIPQSKIKYFTIDKRKISMNISQKNAMKVLEIHAKDHPHIIVGYSAELKSLYEKDFDKFLDIKYNKEKEKFIFQ